MKSPGRGSPKLPAAANENQDPKVVSFAKTYEKKHGASLTADLAIREAAREPGGATKTETEEPIADITPAVTTPSHGEAPAFIPPNVATREAAKTPAPVPATEAAVTVAPPESVSTVTPAPGLENVPKAERTPATVEVPLTEEQLNQRLGEMRSSLVTAEVFAAENKIDKKYKSRAKNDLGTFVPLEKIEEVALVGGQHIGLVNGRRISLTQAEVNLREARRAHSALQEESARRIVGTGAVANFEKTKEMFAFVSKERAEIARLVAEEKGGRDPGALKKVGRFIAQTWAKTPPIARAALLVPTLLLSPTFTGAAIGVWGTSAIARAVIAPHLLKGTGSILNWWYDSRKEKAVGHTLASFNPNNLSATIKELEGHIAKRAKSAERTRLYQTLFALGAGGALGYGVGHEFSEITGYRGMAHANAEETRVLPLVVDANGTRLPAARPWTPPAEQGAVTTNGVTVRTNLTNYEDAQTSTGTRINVGDGFWDKFKEWFNPKPAVPGGGSTDALVSAPTGGVASNVASPDLLHANTEIHGTVWKTFEDQLNQSDQFKGLTQAQKEYIIDGNIRHLRGLGHDRLVALGFKNGNIDLVADGQKVDFSVLKDDSFQQALHDKATGLSKAQQASITHQHAPQPHTPLPHEGLAASGSGRLPPVLPNAESSNRALLEYVSEKYGGVFARDLHVVQDMTAQQVLSAETIPGIDAEELAHIKDSAGQLLLDTSNNHNQTIGQLARESDLYRAVMDAPSQLQIPQRFAKLMLEQYQGLRGLSQTQLHMSVYDILQSTDVRPDTKALVDTMLKHTGASNLRMSVHALILSDIAKNPATKALASDMGNSALTSPYARQLIDQIAKQRPVPLAPHYTGTSPFPSGTGGIDTELGGQY